MKSWSMPLFLGAFFLFYAFGPSSAVAKNAGYCLECHSQKFAFNDSSYSSSAGIESRSVFQAKLNPCPGVSGLTEETFFTESRLVNLNRMAGELDREGTAVNGWRQKAAETGDSLTRMKVGAESSVSGFAKGTGTLRAGLQKVYDQAFQRRAEFERRWLIGLSGILLVLLLLFAAIGYRKLNGFAKKAILLALITGSFSINACTQGNLETKPKSAAQERLDQAQVVASKHSANVEDGFYASVLLAQLAKDWASIDRAGAEKAFQLAWQTALKSREQASQTAEIKKIAEQWPTPAEAAWQKVNFDAVLNLRDDLKGIDGRTWALRAIAEEWSQVNPKEGIRALDSATQQAQGIKEGDVRDIELKAMTESWAGIDESRALETVRAIQNPFLKSVSLAGIAQTIKEKEKAGELFQESWKLTETITPENLKIYARAKISAGAAAVQPQSKTEWAQRAWTAAKDLKDPLLQVYAMQEIVSSWAPKEGEQAEKWANEIPANQPEAKAFAFIQVGKSRSIPKEKAEAALKKALAEADRIEDGFQGEKARSLILTAWAGFNANEAAKSLAKIKDPVLRSKAEARIVKEMAAKNPAKALEAAERISDEFTRNRAILKIVEKKLPKDAERIAALHREAMQIGLSIPDEYTRAMFLIELGKSWGKIDKAKEAAAYEAAEKTAGGISSPSLMAEVFETLAGAWKTLDKPKAQSLIESVDPGVLRARKTVEEVKLWAKTDFGKAKQIAESIFAIYPFEKAQALREAAHSVKKSQPQQALTLLEKAWAAIIVLPEGASRDKALIQVASEAAPLNLDKTLAMVGAISDRQLKDDLFKETGSALLKEEAGLNGASRIAKEISEGSSRTALYQKIAERAAQGEGKPGAADQAALAALGQWGLGREAAKKEDTEAAPYYEKAFLEMGKISDPREKAYILAGLIGDWAKIDEGKALAAAEKIPSDFAEPLSYGLLQVSTQLGKWNRKEADKSFEKTLAAAASIQDASLKAQRLTQIAQQWQSINGEKGKEILKKADGASVRPYIRAKAVLELVKVDYKESIDKNIKLLEKIVQFAQENKNPWIFSAAAVVWNTLDPAKAQELIAQIDSKEARVKALRQMAEQQAKSQPQASRSLLEKASQEAMAMDGLKERITALRAIAGDLAALDSAKAKATYMMAYRAVEKADSITPKF